MRGNVDYGRVEAVERVAPFRRLSPHPNPLPEERELVARTGRFLIWMATCLPVL